MKQDIPITNLLYAIRTSGIGIAKVEKKVGVSKGYFSRLNGTKISLETFLGAAEAVGVPIQDLMDKDFAYKMELKEIEERLDALNRRKAALEKEIKE